MGILVSLVTYVACVWEALLQCTARIILNKATAVVAAINCYKLATC